MISPYAYPGMKYPLKQIENLKFNKCKVTPELVLEVVAKNCGVTIDEILSNTRRRGLVDARHYYCAVLRKQLGYSVTAIGKLVNKDHTTIVHGTQKFYDRCSVDEDYKKVYETILQEIWVRI